MRKFFFKCYRSFSVSRRDESIHHNTHSLFTILHCSRIVNAFFEGLKIFFLRDEYRDEYNIYNLRFTIFDNKKVFFSSRNRNIHDLQSYDLYTVNNSKENVSFFFSKNFSMSKNQNWEKKILIDRRLKITFVKISRNTSQLDQMENGNDLERG